MRILNERQEKLLKSERDLLNRLQMTLVKFDATPEDQSTLKDSLEQLDEFFLLVVVGEFNAGKSAFINALLGQELLKEGVTPTTMQVNMLRHGPPGERTVLNENLHLLTAPSEFLEEVSIVDTPGTNAIIRKHELITARFVPRADLVLFITSADRPFTESERAFLEQIRDWGKKIVIVINKIDILHADTDLGEIETFIAQNARALLGISPEVFPLSARLALRAKQGQPEMWEESRFGPLEEFIRKNLDEHSRVRLKFLNPIGVGLNLLQRYSGIVQGRLDVLKDDFVMLESVESHLGIYKEDMQRDFRLRIADVENILYQVEQQGEEYFEDTLRLARIFDLLDKESVQRGFEEKVMGNVAEQIDRKVNDLIDWLVESNFNQWQTVTDHLAERRRQHKDQIVGDIGTFRYDRERIMEGVGREAQRVVETFDREAEARELADGTQAAVAAVAAVEISAVGLGAAIAPAATTAAADFTGILLASVIAALGLFIIPARKRQAKMDLRAKMSEMRARLGKSLQEHFDTELERSLGRIREAVAPYTRFVRAEGEKLNTVKTELDALRNEFEGLKMVVEEM